MSGIGWTISTREPPRRLKRMLGIGASVLAKCAQYAIEHDGFRFVCRRELDHVRVFSRRSIDWTDRVPRPAGLTALRVTSITLDGEGVVCGPDGVSNFEMLRTGVGRKPCA